MRDGCSMGWLFYWNMFDKSLFFRYISFKSKFSILLFYITVIFIHFYNVFAPDWLKISSVLNYCLPGFRWWARFHIVLVYNNEDMRFIRLLLANQTAYIFRSNDKRYFISFKYFIRQTYLFFYDRVPTLNILLDFVEN